MLLDKIQKLPEYEVNLDYYTNDIDYNEDPVHNGKQGYEKNLCSIINQLAALLSDWFIKYVATIHGQPPFQLHTKLSVTDD